MVQRFRSSELIKVLSFLPTPSELELVLIHHSMIILISKYMFGTRTSWLCLKYEEPSYEKKALTKSADIYFLSKKRGQAGEKIGDCGRQGGDGCGRRRCCSVTLRACLCYRLGSLAGQARLRWWLKVLWKASGSLLSINRIWYGQLKYLHLAINCTCMCMVTVFWWCFHLWWDLDFQLTERKIPVVTWVYVHVVVEAKFAACWSKNIKLSTTSPLVELNQIFTISSTIVYKS